MTEVQKYRCEDCRFFGKIIGLTDACGKAHFKPDVAWGMCRREKRHEIVEKISSCRHFEKRKEQNNDR